jgi:hypothetical protein
MIDGHDAVERKKLLPQPYPIAQAGTSPQTDGLIARETQIAIFDRYRCIRAPRQTDHTVVLADNKKAEGAGLVSFGIERED